MNQPSLPHMTLQLISRSEAGSVDVVENKTRRRTMPDYDFKCTACRKRFTESQTFEEHDRGLVKCPKCGSEKVERVIGAVFAKTSKKS